MRFTSDLTILLAASALALVPGCSREDEKTFSVAPKVRDSVGVRLVEYDSLPLKGTLRVDPRPYLDLGGLSKSQDTELDSRHPWLGAVRLSDGRVVVNEPTRLKFFGPDGRYLFAVGRSGNGPGELNQSREICLLRGDTLLVIDYMTGALREWDKDGNHVRSTARPGAIPTYGCAANGLLVVYAAPFKLTLGTSDSTREYRIANAEGRDLGKFGVFPAPKYFGPVFFEPSIVPFERQVFVGDPHSFGFRTYSQEGRLRVIVRLARPSRAISDEDWNRMVERMLPKTLPAATRATAIARVMSRPRPRSYPSQGRMRVDPAGRIWIGEYDDRLRWTVFDTAGQFLGRTVLPWPEKWGRTELVGVGSDHIIIRRLDNEGAVHLSFHRITSYNASVARQNPP